MNISVIIQHSTRDFKKRADFFGGVAYTTLMKGRSCKDVLGNGNVGQFVDTRVQSVQQMVDAIGREEQEW